MAAGFLLLSYEDTLRYWNSVHFYFHWIIGIVIVTMWLNKAFYLVATGGKGFYILHNRILNFIIS